MSLYRILTVPLEVRCRHTEDEPTLAELVEWLRDGRLTIEIIDEDYPSSIGVVVEHIHIEWSGVVESLGHRGSPWADDENEGEDEQPA